MSHALCLPSPEQPSALLPPPQQPSYCLLLLDPHTAIQVDPQNGEFSDRAFEILGKMLEVSPVKFQPNLVAPLYHRCTTAPLYPRCAPAVPPCHRCTTAVPLLYHHRTTVPPYRCTTTVRLYRCATVPYHRRATVPLCCCTAVPLYRYATVSTYCCILAKQVPFAAIECELKYEQIQTRMRVWLLLCGALLVTSASDVLLFR